MSNLPPGVSESMIPGNRPEDEAEDAFFDELEARLKTSLGADHLYPVWIKLFDDEPSEEVILEAVQIARTLGYEAGTADARIEADLYVSDEDKQRLDELGSLAYEEEEEEE